MRWKKVDGTDNWQLADYGKMKYAAYEAALKKHWRLEKKWDEEDRRNQHRMIEIRKFLWT